MAQAASGKDGWGSAIQSHRAVEEATPPTAPRGPTQQRSRLPTLPCSSWGRTERAAKRPQSRSSDPLGPGALLEEGSDFGRQGRNCGRTAVSVDEAAGS